MITKTTLSRKFIKTTINVNKDAKIGNNLNHICDVDIESVNGNQGSLFLSLICNQKTDNGKNNFANVPRNAGKIKLLEYKKMPDNK